jgi:YggT family protein
MIIMICQALYLFEHFLELMIFARCLISWFPINRDNPIVKLLYSITEPIMGPFRRMFNNSPLGGGMGIDFSPVLALIAVNFVFGLIIRVVSML